MRLDPDLHASASQLAAAARLQDLVNTINFHTLADAGRWAARPPRRMTNPLAEWHFTDSQKVLMELGYILPPRRPRPS